MKIKFTLLLFLVCISTAHLLAQVNCRFGASSLSGCAPLTVIFTDSSTGNPTSFYWDFDNTNTSTLVNPTATFSTAGIYNIKHIVSNSSSSDTAILQIRVFLPASPDFAAPDNRGCAPPCHLVNFTNLTIAGESPVSQDVWDYGDGSLAEEGFNTSHCFSAVGNYNVTLIVLDSNGCQASKILNNYVTIGMPPTSNATATPLASCSSPQIVSFTATGSSPNGAVSFNWYFGNGGTSALQNTSNVYFSGIYNPFVIVTDAIGCVDTTFLQVAVTNVVAGFSSTTNACSGIAVQFTDTSNFATSWNWNFGDGGTSTAKNPTHVYSSNGTYQVSLTVTYGNCTDSETRPSYINVTSPVNFTISADDTTNCTAPFTVNFTSNVSGSASAYNWNFGNGQSSTQANPAHTFTTAGIYTVTLGVTNASGCENVRTLSTRVIIGGPQASFIVDSTGGCTPATIRFTNTSISNSPITSYAWAFGDGTFSGQTNPNYVYNVAGNYIPRLIIVNSDGCRDTFVYPDTIKIGQTFNPAFFADPLIQCVNQLVTFTNQTVGVNGATQYLWEFGDGQTSVLPNPTHEYSDTGRYDITLTVINQGCPSVLTRIRYIQIVVPKADFNFAFDCTNPTTVAFNDTSQGADTWFWNFGDGGTSTLQDPTHTFPNQSNFNVTLIVSNLSTGCVDSMTKILPIGTPSSGFRADTFAGCIPLRVTFRDTSTFASSWLWKFGDGTTSALQNPIHSYADTGRFSVTLIINPGQICSDSIVKINYITAYGVKAGFLIPIVTGCTPFAAIFTNTSVSFGGTLTNYVWTFGNGDSSFIASPTYSYLTQGNYTARLRVTDSKGCTALASRFIAPRTILANFISDTAVCPGESILFTNQSSNSQTYIWDFGDGGTSSATNPTYSYGSVGTYTITLIARNTALACTDTLIIPNFMDVDTPTANFYVTTNFAPCPPFPVQFYNTTNRTDLQWLWHFGDGDTSTAYNPLHVYFLPGDFDVTLISYDSSGCRDSITYVDLIRVRGPIGNFTASTDSGCVPLTINVSGTNDRTVSMVSNFGDGTSVSDSLNINHTYTDAGNYIIIYTLTDSVGCTVPYNIDTIAVGIIPYPNLPDDTTVCRGNYVQFNLPLGDYFLWQSSSQPSYLNCDTCKNALAAALDTITYYVTASTNIGCVAKDTITVNVDALPQIFPGILFRICAGDTLQLTAGPLATAAIWEPFYFMDDSTIVNPKVWPPDSTDYRVTGFNSTGCSISRIVKVLVINQVVADLEISDTILCDGGNVQLRINVTEASFNDTSFLWNPAQYLSSAIINNPVLNAPHGQYVYTVTTTSSTCIPDIDTVRITIAPNPVVEAGDDQTVAVGTNLQVWASSPDDVNYQWYPIDEMTCTDCRRPYLTANQDQKIPVVATNAFGCTDTAYVTIKVVTCEPEKVFVPNTFTPNNDGLNDKLYVRGIGLRSLDYFRIFDRWGKLVYDNKNISDGWDGKMNGKDADVGTYVYLVKGVCSSGNAVEKSGNVTLVR